MAQDPGRASASSLDAIYESVGRLTSTIDRAKKKGVPDAVIMRAVQKEILRRARATQEKAWPTPSGGGGGPQRIAVRIDYKQRDGFVVPMEWDVIPAAGYTTVLGFCPEHYRLAPTQTDWRTGTQPTVREGTLLGIKGNPEADRQLRVFSWSGPDVMIEWGPRGQPLLTVGRVMPCSHVKECGWAVRVERGRAYWSPHGGIVRSGSKAGGAPTGPLILVK